MKTFKGTPGKWIAKGSNVNMELEPKAIVAMCMGFNIESNSKLIAAAPELLKALLEISKGNGAYDLEPLKHASNCIDNMKSIAEEAIKKVLS